MRLDEVSEMKTPPEYTHEKRSSTFQTHHLYRLLDKVKQWVYFGEHETRLNSPFTAATAVTPPIRQKDPNIADQGQIRFASNYL